MSLQIRSLARGPVTMVNPDTTATLRKATGYTTDSAFKRVPVFEDTKGLLQVQAVTARELQFVEGQNQNDVLRKVILDGRWSAVNRQELGGGDKFIFALSGSRQEFLWKVVQVLEAWADWSSVIVALEAPWPLVPNPPNHI